VTHLNLPSVRTERSCKTNQKPDSPLLSFKVEALTVKLPIRFLVNIEALWGTAAAIGTGPTGYAIVAGAGPAYGFGMYAIFGCTA
jgi:hypothetical protein